MAKRSKSDADTIATDFHPSPETIAKAMFLVEKFAERVGKPTPKVHVAAWYSGNNRKADEIYRALHDVVSLDCSYIWTGLRDENFILASKPYIERCGGWSRELITRLVNVTRDALRLWHQHPAHNQPVKKEKKVSDDGAACAKWLEAKPSESAQRIIDEAIAVREAAERAWDTQRAMVRRGKSAKESEAALTGSRQKVSADLRQAILAADAELRRIEPKLGKTKRVKKLVRQGVASERVIWDTLPKSTARR
jgi:hypothetical protein